MIQTSEIKAYFDRCLGSFCFWVLPSFVSNSKVEVRLIFFCIDRNPRFNYCLLNPTPIYTSGKIFIFFGTWYWHSNLSTPWPKKKKKTSDLTFLFSGALHFIASNNDSGVREYDMERYQQYKHFRFDWPVNVSTFVLLFPIFGFFNFVYLHKRRILKINRNHGENMFLRLCLKSGEYRYMFLKQ